MFNFVKFLEDFNVHYETKGNNISPGWIGIRCLFCDDPSEHLGFELKGEQKIKCWRCGGHSLLNIIQEITDHNPFKIIRSYKGQSEIEIQEKIFDDSEEKTGCKLPDEAFPLTTRHRRYLIDRGFNSKRLEIDWKILGTTTTGDYKFRIIIPVYHKGELVSFQGRDITGKQIPYKTCAGTLIKNYLYGLDCIKHDSVIVVEGVTGVWKLGKGKAVATFGIEYTQRQLVKLVKREFKHIGILFDNEPQAQTKAIELTESLNCFKDVSAVNLRCPAGKDSGNLSAKEVQKVFKRFYKTERKGVENGYERNKK